MKQSILLKFWSVYKYLILQIPLFLPPSTVKHPNRFAYTLGPQIVFSLLP